MKKHQKVHQKTEKVATFQKIHFLRKRHFLPKIHPVCIQKVGKNLSKNRKIWAKKQKNRAKSEQLKSPLFLAPSPSLPHFVKISETKQLMRCIKKGKKVKEKQ